MSPAPVTIHPETTVEQVLELFQCHDYNAFPAVNERNVLKGDLLRGITEEASLLAAAGSG
jgi:CBS domain-containing protein